MMNPFTKYCLKKHKNNAEVIMMFLKPNGTTSRNTQKPKPHSTRTESKNTSHHHHGVHVTLPLILLNDKSLHNVLLKMQNTMREPSCCFLNQIAPHHNTKKNINLTSQKIRNTSHHQQDVAGYLHLNLINNKPLHKLLWKMQKQCKSHHNVFTPQEHKPKHITPSSSCASYLHLNLIHDKHLRKDYILHLKN